MITAQWEKEIKSLRESLKLEISKISRGSEINVVKHICRSNLESKLDRLKEIEEILKIEKYKIVFIGTIGQGKTTAICHIFNLISDFKVSKTIGGKSRNVIETKELLATGSGRTTICEVILKASAKTYIEIEPYTVDEMENLILEFCDSIADEDNSESEQKIMISQEVERAIRNIIELKISFKSVMDGDKKRNQKIDKAEELFNELGLEGLKKTALNTANLEFRTTTRIDFDNQDSEQEWIKNTFAAINNVESKDFAIPRKIYLYVSSDVLSGSDLSKFDSVIDTKGIDENPIRKDLQKYIESQDTICLFVTPFNAAPEANISKLIGYHLTSKSKDFHHRFVTLVLPRKNEPEKANEGDGTWEKGIQIKQEVIQTVFRNLNLEFFPDNILFYDAFRYYREDIIKLNSDFYGQEDVQADKNEFIKAIADIVENRRIILLKEIGDIQESFKSIKSGHFLTEIEITAIQNAIQKIKNLRELRKRVPSFVYEHFIEQYLEYYHTVCRAWNTKHAVHRNFGYYEPRDIDIYYNGNIVAAGTSDDEMLRKFTKEVRKELEYILFELTLANESLKTFIPELVREFHSFYDDFIKEVGTEIEDEIERKLSPQSEKSEFWNALIAEKGREHKNGETYTDNVLQTFRRELELEPNLNDFLQSKAEEHWEELVNKILDFFGEE